MELTRILITAMVLAALTGSALAELKLIEREEIGSPDEQRARGVPPELQRGYLKLTSEDGRQYMVSLIETSADLETLSYFLRIDDFFGGDSLRRVALDKPREPAHMSAAPQQGILAIGTQMGEWSVIRLNKGLTKVEKYSEIKSMLVPGLTTKIGDKYFIGGQGKDKRPFLIKMSADLKIEREVKVPSRTEGGASGVFALKSGKLITTLGFTDGTEIWEVSPDLSTLKQIKLPYVGAHGIPLRDGGFAVTYLSLPDMDVYVERFDSSSQPVWKKKIISKSRPFTGFTLVELQQGVGLVVGNSDRLLVARIDANGQHVRVAEDKQSGLTAPTGPYGYLVGVLNDTIHVRGLASDKARKQGSKKVLFHFVETP